MVPPPHVAAPYNPVILLYHAIGGLFPAPPFCASIAHIFMVVMFYHLITRLYGYILHGEAVKPVFREERSPGVPWRGAV